MCKGTTNLALEHVNMMLDCNLKLFCQAVLLAKSPQVYVYLTQDTRICTDATGYPTSTTVFGICVGWSEPENNVYTSGHMTFSAFYILVLYVVTFPVRNMMIIII